MCLTNVCIEAQLFLRKFVVSKGERERERDREREVGGAGGPGRGLHYLDDRTLLTAGLQDIIDCRPTLMSHRHALTVSMVGALHQTIDIIQQENTRNYLIQFDRNCKPCSLQRLSVID